MLEWKLRPGPAQQFLHQQFPHTRPLLADCRARLRAAETIRPTSVGDASPPYATLGLAFHYRTQYYQRAFGPECSLAGSGASMLASDRLSEGLVNAFFEYGQALVDRACPAGRRCGRSEEQDLASMCYIMALFEESFRAGLHIRSPLYTLGPGARLPDLLELAAAPWIDDLCQLSWLFHDRCAGLMSGSPASYPSFGGYNADLIVGHCLVELKVTVRPEDTLSRAIYQLLAYVLLDEADRLESAALYLARQGLLFRWPLRDFLEGLSGGAAAPLADLRRQFQGVRDSL